MTSRQYDAMDERVAAEIKRLHKRHPKLGHHGLLEALRQEEIHVDQEELASFLKQNHIEPDRGRRFIRLLPLPKWWVGGPPDLRG